VPIVCVAAARRTHLLGARLQMPRKRKSPKDKRTKNDSRTTEEWMQSLVFEWAKAGYKGP
jgi:hypothetical protein